MKRINTRHIKAKRSYTVERLATLCGVHPNTVHEWVKQGLPRMDGSYPYTFWGQEVIDFLNARQRKNKVTLAVDEFYCCKCQAPRKAWEGVAELAMRTSKTGNLKALCEQCDTRLHKLISLAKLAEIKNALTLLASTLVQPTNNSTNCETKGVENHAAI
jgi:hypothetical protein